MFEDVIFHAGIGQRTGGIDTHGFQLSRDQLHRCDAAIADPCGERFAVDEGSALTPKAKPGRIGQIVDVGTTSGGRSEEHTSELQSLMRISYAVFCLKKKKEHNVRQSTHTHRRTTL